MLACPINAQRNFAARVAEASVAQPQLTRIVLAIRLAPDGCLPIGRETRRSIACAVHSGVREQ
jgi:hypothetical protein